MKTTLLIALLILSATVTAVGQKSIDQRIRQLDSERIQAQINADTVALKRIYSDDFIGEGPSHR